MTGVGPTRTVHTDGANDPNCKVFPLLAANHSARKVAHSAAPYRTSETLCPESRRRVACRVVALRSIQVPPNCDLTLGMVCTDKTTPGRCTWTMNADERFANPAGIIQGGFLSAFADSAMGAAAVTFVTGRKVIVANAELKISFMAAAQTGTTLTCVAEVVSGGGRVAFVEATISDSADRMVARATSTYLFRERK